MYPKAIQFLHSDEFDFISEEPVFYYPEEFPTIQEVIKHYPVIKKELEEYLERKINFEASNPNAPAKNLENAWSHMYMLNYMIPYSGGKKNFSKTSKLLLSRPDITLCGIAKLSAGGRLMPHCGETNAIVRCHLGLKIPGSLPQVGIRVRDEQRCWQEGKVLAFNDAYNHEAWNRTDQDRFVLIFDIIRPEFLRYKNFICSYCLGIASARILLGKANLYNGSPIWLRKLIAIPLAIGWYVVLSFKSLLKNPTP